MSLAQKLSEISHDHKLKEYYRVVQFLGPFALLIIGYFIFTFPQYLLFLGPTRLVLFLIIGVFFAHVIGFLLHEIFKSKIYFTLLRYSWVVFFCIEVVATGGMKSTLVYFFIFPILVAAVDMEEKDLMRTIYAIFAFLLSLFLVYPNEPLETKFRYGFTVFILALFSYFIYKLAKEKAGIHKDYDRLVNLDRIKTDFVTVASNRLRTPVTGTVYALTDLFEELSKSSTSSPQSIKAAEGGLKESKIALAIVEELTEAMELDTYHFNVLPTPIDLSDVMRDIASSLAPIAKKSKAALIIDIPHHLVVTVNPKMIRQAFLNVIENALIYSPEGTVKVMAKYIGQEVSVTVEDNGIGMDEKDVPLVFERLFRTEEAMKIDPNRSGIGLYTTKRIVDLHHGTITFSSVKGKGTVVHILLPMV